MSDQGNGTSTMAALTPAKQLADLRTYLESSKTRLAEIVPKTLTPERLVRVACASMSRQPKLLACSRESILLAIMEAGQLGLEAGSPLGHAYLVPFPNRRTNKLEATLVIGYKGLIELARRGGQVASVEARVVYSKDSFDCEFGLNPKLVHRPHWGSDRGQPMLAYAVLRLVDANAEPIVDVMSAGEIDAIRRRSPAGDLGPWVTDWAEMARKTVLRRALKYAPMSIQLAEAVERDEMHDAGELPIIDVTSDGPVMADHGGSRTEEVKEKLRRKRQPAPAEPDSAAAAPADQGGTSGETAVAAPTP